jgi:putative NADH-flavin reductase
LRVGSGDLPLFQFLRRIGSEFHPEATGRLYLGEFIDAHRPLWSQWQVGSRILTELLTRDHQVTAITRDPVKTDAVVSAHAPPPDDTDQLLPVTERLVEAVKQAGVRRLLIVGGAGSLEVAPGVTVIASGHLPVEWMPIAVSHANLLDQLKKDRHQLDLLQSRRILRSG